MDIHPFRGQSVSALIFRRYPGLHLISFPADIYIIIDKVFTQSCDLHPDPVHVIVPQQHFISRSDSHAPGCFRSNNRLSLSRISDLFTFLSMQIQESRHLFGVLRNHHIQRFGLPLKVQIHALLIAVCRPGQQSLCLLRHIIHICLCQRFLKRDPDIINLDLIILSVRNIYHRIPDSQPCNQKSSTSADSQYHHKKPFFIPYNISDRHFMQELQSVPDKSDSFQKNALSVFGRFRTDQTGRCTVQFITAGKKSRSHGT